MEKSSFFSRIQSWFDGGYHGRYLAFILAEIGQQHPEIMATFLSKVLGVGKRQLKSVGLQPEYVFQGELGTRRADLAVWADREAAEPLALIEIKYHDRLLLRTDKKAAQVEDYRRWKHESGGEVLILSLETLRPDPDFVLRTWTQVAQLLAPAATKSDLVRALIEHLNEEGIVMQNIDSRALVGFLSRLLVPARGAGPQAGNLEGPTEFGKLLHNTRLLSTKFNPHFKEAWKSAGDRLNKEMDPYGTKNASVDFTVSNRVRTSPRAQSIVDGTLRTDHRNGGVVNVFARHSLGSGKGWLRVGYGFWIEVVPKKNDETGTPNAWLYAWANGELTGSLESKAKKLSWNQVTAKAEDSSIALEQYIRAGLDDVLKQLLNQPKNLTKKQATAIRQLSTRMSG